MNGAWMGRARVLQADLSQKHSDDGYMFSDRWRHEASTSHLGMISSVLFCVLLSCLVSVAQDEDMDVYAVVTGLFEQVFTISREFPYGGGGQTPSGTGSATQTEG